MLDSIELKEVLGQNLYHIKFNREEEIESVMLDDKLERLAKVAIVVVVVSMITIVWALVVTPWVC